MPIYEYTCSACGERTDMLHGRNDPTPAFCPVCGAEGVLRKAFAPPTILFKGSGWAKKDRSTASNGARASATDGSDAGAADGKAPTPDAAATPPSGPTTAKHGSKRSSPGATGGETGTSKAPPSGSRPGSSGEG